VVRSFRAAAVLLPAVLGASCARAASPSVDAASVSQAPVAAPSTEPQAAPRDALPWATFGPETFARARAEHRFVVLDGAAEWCHWCHVMEATTYHDPTVQTLLAESFIAAKVDIDTRPDIEERYGDWGWPATVVFSPEGEELGKYRGYIQPVEFPDALRRIVAAGVPGTPLSAKAKAGPAGGVSLVGRRDRVDRPYDGARAGRLLGPARRAVGATVTRSRGAPITNGPLQRARAGDAELRDQGLLALDRQRQIIDPVWGGIDQYSTDGDWRHPHYEKLMTYQAGALDNYAAAYALTGDPRWLETAHAVEGFIAHFMTSPEGTFYTTMDADLNAHDASRPFVAGARYYAVDDGGRRRLGVPRIDTHVYALENGLTMGAYVTLFEVAHDARALGIATRAARRILETHSRATGAVTHEGGAGGERSHLSRGQRCFWVGAHATLRGHQTRTCLPTPLDWETPSSQTSSTAPTAASGHRPAIRTPSAFLRYAVSRSRRTCSRCVSSAASRRPRPPTATEPSSRRRWRLSPYRSRSGPEVPHSATFSRPSKRRKAFGRSHIR